MKRQLALFFVLVAFGSFAQNNVWQKNDRQNIMDEGIALLSKHDIPRDKKEQIGQCYMKYITETYKPNDYKNFIEYELKTIQNGAITKCAKDFGFDIGDAKEEKPKAENNTLAGHWKTEKFDLWLMEYGDLKMEYPDGKIIKGRWKLDGNIFTTTITSGKDKDINYKVLSNSGDTFIYQTLEKKPTTFKADRIKP